MKEISISGRQNIKKGKRDNYVYFESSVKFMQRLCHDEASTLYIFFTICLQTKKTENSFSLFSEKRPSLRIFELLDYSCWKSIRMRFPEFRVFRKACFFVFFFQKFHK